MTVPQSRYIDMINVGDSKRIIKGKGAGPKDLIFNPACTWVQMGRLVQNPI
jgi:hypothetical protein